MTGIGRSTDSLDPDVHDPKALGPHAPNPQTSVSARDVRRGSPRMHALLESLTHSLDLACRGYLCAPLVDGAPMSARVCGPTGKKVQFPEPAKAAGRILSVNGAESVFEGDLHEGLPGK